MNRVRSFLVAVVLAAGLSSGVAVGASAPYDFALGQNAVGQSCRAQTHFGGDKQARQIDIYCGDWDRPSGSLTLLPVARKADAERLLAAQCDGTAKPLQSPEFSDMRQIACAGRQSEELRRYGLIATRGTSVVAGSVLPSDWAPLVKSAAVLTGAEQPSAVVRPEGESPGMREIDAVFPSGPPGQSAAFNYELLRRRAYEKNALWNFDGAQQDFSELLRAHRAVVPDDIDGEAEILAELALNLSSVRRFDEADEVLAQADAKAAEAEDPLLSTKIANYRAIHLMNQRRYAEAIDVATKANEARSHLAQAKGSQKGGDVNISSADSKALEVRADKQRRRWLVVGLGETSLADRSAILSAQADYLAGAADVALGSRDADKWLDEASNRLYAVQAPPPWLVSQISEQQARARLNRGDGAGAISAARAGLVAVRASAPETRSEAHLLMVLGRAQRLAGQADQALESERKGVAMFAAQRETPGMPAEIASDYFAGLLAAWTKSNDPALAAEFFEASAFVWDGAAARSATQLAARLASKEASGEARAYQDVERSYRSALARRERLAVTKDVGPQQIAAADAEVQTASAALAKSQDALRARSPRFLELLDPKVTAPGMMAALQPDEGYLRIVLSGSGSYGVLVSPGIVTPYRINLTESQVDKLAGRMRDSNSVRRGRLADFDVAAASDLYQALFTPIEGKLGNVKRLQIDAGGSLAAIPFAALITTPPTEADLQRIKTDQDYHGLPWLARKLALAQSVGPAPFVRMRGTAQAQARTTAAIFGDFVPAPKLVAARLAESRGLSPHCQDEVQKALARLGALPDTAGEARQTAALFGDAAHVSLGAQFTDASFLSSPDVGDAGVIVLATHGVLGLSSCFAEPALLTSVGPEGDGLIEASALLDRQLHARLVVLSACDTAGGGKADVALTGLSDGGEALSGLARAFLYAGASSVLASQWKVDATASAAEVETFFKGALHDGLPLSVALNKAQATLYDEAETGHPFYWSGFALIGDGNATLAKTGAPAVVAAK